MLLCCSSGTLHGSLPINELLLGFVRPSHSTGSDPWTCLGILQRVDFMPQFHPHSELHVLEVIVLGSLQQVLLFAGLGSILVLTLMFLRKFLQISHTANLVDTWNTV